MNDVSPEILEAVKKEFDKRFYSNEAVKKIYEKVRRGKASFAEMKKFAEMAGDILGEALGKTLSPEKLPDGKLYQNIAEKVITPMLQQNHGLVNEVCGYVMDDMNKAARIGVNTVTAKFNGDRAEKIAQIAANAGGVKKGSNAARLITNMSLSFVDDFIRVNADLHKDLGMRPQIQRIYHGKPGACGFCEKKVYSDDYKGPKMPEGIFQRHKDCKCTLIYKPQKGKYQDPWSKKEASEYEKLISDQRSYLTELDKMTPAERKLARNARARERRRSKYSASEWNEHKAMQARMQRIKEKEASLNAGGKTVSNEKRAEVAAEAAKDKAERTARIIARMEELQRKREAEKATRKTFASSKAGSTIKKKRDGADRAKDYASGWPSGSLKEAIKKFAPDAQIVKDPGSGKVHYISKAGRYEVIEDTRGNYFRIIDHSLPGKKMRRKYTDLDGNDMRNITEENGRTRGRHREEYEQATHFNNTD